MASRRYLNLSDESTFSVDENLRPAAEAANKYISASSQSDIIEFNSLGSGDEALRRYLSVRSVLSTGSSEAIKQQQQAEADTSGMIEIGSGFCGVIFDIRGTGKVAKRATGVKQHQLYTDYVHHSLVFHEFQNVPCMRVPKVHYFVSTADAIQWSISEETHFVDTRFKEPAAMLVTERIQPLPEVIRNALIDTFCPREQIMEAKADVKNRSCLVRLYLGSEIARHGNSQEKFSLRNFDMTLDRMKQLGLNVFQYAVAMGEALAMMHWRCKVDAYDVELVLGSAPKKRKLTPSQIRALPKNTSTWSNQSSIRDTGLDFRKRTVEMWLLDFNQCGEIEETEAGVEQAVRAFWENDPYYPRPSSDQSAWEDGYQKQFAKARKELKKRKPTQREDPATRIADLDNKNAELVSVLGDLVINPAATPNTQVYHMEYDHMMVNVEDYKMMPRLNCVTNEWLWKTFSDKYLERSNILLLRKTGLPEKFVGLIEKEAKKRGKKAAPPQASAMPPRQSTDTSGAQQGLSTDQTSEKQDKKKKRKSRSYV